MSIKRLERHILLQCTRDILQNRPHAQHVFQGSDTNMSFLHVIVGTFFRVFRSPACRKDWMSSFLTSLCKQLLGPFVSQDKVWISLAAAQVAEHPLLGNGLGPQRQMSASPHWTALTQTCRETYLDTYISTQMLSIKHPDICTGHKKNSYNWLVFLFSQINQESHTYKVWVLLLNHFPAPQYFCCWFLCCTQQCSGLGYSWLWARVSPGRTWGILWDSRDGSWIGTWKALPYLLYYHCSSPMGDGSDGLWYKEISLPFGMMHRGEK